MSPPCTTLAPIPVIILAGGLGTRIRGVLGDTPKVMAPIHGRPFLDHLLAWLATQGARRVVLCLGHGAARVLAHLDASPPPAALTVKPVVEDRPLGTAGALRLAAETLPVGPMLVMNGDTWLEADLGAFTLDHAAHGGLASLLCVSVDDARRFGRIESDDDGWVTRFVEKDSSHHGPALVSAGIVLLSTDAVARLRASEGPSLETDFLATLPPHTLRTHVARGMFIDIGTPDSLERAPQVIASALTKA